MLSKHLQMSAVSSLLIGLVVLSIVIFGITTPVSAQDESVITYNLIAPLPGGSNQVGGDSIFVGYAKQLFVFLLTTAAVLTFFVLVFSGIEYMGSAGNPNTMKDARSRITEALIGLVLAVGSYLFLQTINPDLVSMRLDIPKIDGSAFNNLQNSPSSNQTPLPGTPGAPDFVGPVQPPPPPPVRPAAF